MDGLKHIEKIREYCDYVEEHLINVGKAWDIVRESCRDMNFIYDDFLFHNIDNMIRSHDLSKLSPEEFIQYQQFFYPVGDVKDTELFKSAWDNHLKHNLHHWQSWVEIEEKCPNELACHCVCMVCDWMAMGMKFNDTAEEYYTKNKDKIDIPEWAVTFIGEMFTRLRRT